MFYTKSNRSAISVDFFFDLSAKKKTIVVPIAVPRALKFRELVSSRLIKFKIYFTRNGMKNCFMLFARQQHLVVRCLLENRALNTVRLRLLNY